MPVDPLMGKPCAPSGGMHDNKIKSDVTMVMLWVMVPEILCGPGETSLMIGAGHRRFDGVIGVVMRAPSLAVFHLNE